MGNKNISRDTKLSLVQPPLASAGTDPFSAWVDMQGFDAVRFVGILGTAAGATDDATLHAIGSSSTGSTGTAITGATQSSSAGADDKYFCIDLPRPRERFIRTKITRSAAIEYGGTIAEQYNPFVKPTVNDADTAASTGAACALVVEQTT